MRGRGRWGRRCGAWRWGVVALGLVGGAAFASDEVRVIHEKDRTIYRKKTVVDFNDVAVEGELTKPEGSYVLNRGKSTFQSLVKVRDNFAPELRKSVNDL
jgi:hypothetical protein